MGLVVSDLRALSPGQYQSVLVFGSEAEADGGGGIYLWQGSATDADNGALWVKPTATDPGNAGRWRRISAHATPASTAQVRSGAAGVYIDPAGIYASQAPVALTSGANVPVNFDAGQIFELTLGHNCLIQNPTNFKTQAGLIWIYQGGANNFTVSWDTQYTFIGGAPTIPTGAGAFCVVAYHGRAVGDIRCAATVP